MTTELDLDIEYHTIRLRDLQPDAEIKPDDGRRGRTPPRLCWGGESLAATPRFWRSLFHRFGLNEVVFRYFEPAEVFARVVERERDDALRVAVERRENARGKLLAVSPTKRPVLPFGTLRGLIDQHVPGGFATTKARYHQGIVTTEHAPRSGELGFAIGPDAFRNRFVLETPVDGFGQPRIYLSLLREVCSNGAVGYTRSFRSDLRVGNDVEWTLRRALDQFDHEEGFAALRQRFESAQASWASVGEVLKLRRLVTQLGAGAGGSLDRLDKMAGDLPWRYGVANLDTLSAKRQRVLPAKCRVYDLLNFASELATHHAQGSARDRLQAFIGGLVSDEYDLEGTAGRVPQFDDFFLNN